MDNGSDKRIRVYVGCGLTHAPPDFIQEVERFKRLLKTHCTVLDFMGISQTASPREIYEWDIHKCVMGSDLMIAIANYPSTGMGYEASTQIELRRKPVLFLASATAKVSDLILDINHPFVQFRRYDSLVQDGMRYAIEAISSILAQQEADAPLFTSA